MARTKKTTRAQPYDKLDLFRPASEGRSLHDDANKFYREVMQLATPISKRYLPKSKDVIQAILDVPRANNINQILFDLHASSIEDLWPGNKDPPPDFVGILWNAVHKAWEGQQDKQTESPTSKVDSIVLPSKPAVLQHAALEFSSKPSSLEGNSKPSAAQGKDLATASEGNSEATASEPYTMDFIIDQDNHIMLPMEDYFPHLQDRGVEISKKKRPKNMFIPKVTNTRNRVSLGYPKLHELSSSLYDIMKGHEKTFSKIPKNKCNVITRIAKWLFDN